MRLDPNKGETIRGYDALEESVRAAAVEYESDAFGKNSFSGHESNRLFLSRGGEQFSDLSGVSGAGHMGDGRSVVLWDYDRDGWTDIASINTNYPKLTLFHNEVAGFPGIDPDGRNIVALRFNGGNNTASPSPGLSNRDGVGARVTLSTGDKVFVCEHQRGEGVYSQNSSTMLIGVGAHATIDRVTVRWPSGISQSIEDVPAGSLITAFESPSHSPNQSAFTTAPYAPGLPQ